MGELNLDNIDRALMQEYERYHEGFRLKEAARIVGSIQPGQKVPEHGQRHQASLVCNCVGARKH